MSGMVTCGERNLAIGGMVRLQVGSSRKGGNSNVKGVNLIDPLLLSAQCNRPGHSSYQETLLVRANSAKKYTNLRSLYPQNSSQYTIHLNLYHQTLG